MREVLTMSKPTTHQAARATSTGTSKAAFPTLVPQTTRSTSTECELIRLHAQACNGLHAALQLLTDTSTTAPDSAVFGRALARAMRATAALKQACAEVNRGAA
jgi:hypothetical protein